MLGYSILPEFNTRLQGLHHVFFWPAKAGVQDVSYLVQVSCPPSRVDTKWHFQFFAKYDYRFLLDVIIAIIATFFAKAIIVISRLSLSISLE